MTGNIQICMILLGCFFSFFVWKRAYWTFYKITPFVFHEWKQVIHVCNFMKVRKLWLFSSGSTIPVKKRRKWKRELHTCGRQTLQSLFLESGATRSILRNTGPQWGHSQLEADGVIAAHRFADMRATVGLHGRLLNYRTSSHPETCKWGERMQNNKGKELSAMTQTVILINAKILQIRFPHSGKISSATVKYLGQIYGKERRNRKRNKKKKMFIASLNRGTQLSMRPHSLGSEIRHTWYSHMIYITEKRNQGQGGGVI